MLCEVPEKKQKLQKDLANGDKGNKKTVKPKAAVKEKERLKTFNQALERLQSVIPVKLPEGRKLHKKQTLQLACRYIHFLRDCLDGKRSYSDRGRFWCETDEEQKMINAIDEAATAAFSMKKIHATRKPKEKQKRESKIFTGAVASSSASNQDKGCVPSTSFEDFSFWAPSHEKQDSFFYSQDHLPKMNFFQFSSNHEPQPSNYYVDFNKPAESSSVFLGSTFQRNISTNNFMEDSKPKFSTNFKKNQIVTSKNNIIEEVGDVHNGRKTQVISENKSDTPELKENREKMEEFNDEICRRKAQKVDEHDNTKMQELDEAWNELKKYIF